MQKEIENQGSLLDGKGELREAGYAKTLLLHYDRSDIKASKLRIKEWDYYLIHNQQHAVALTVADNSYMGLISVSFIDFTQPWFRTASILKAFPLGKLGLPNTSEHGNVVYDDKRIKLSFLHRDGGRELTCSMKNFVKRKNFYCSFTLEDEPEDSMVIATPFKENRKAFYYNQKINCMRANGHVVYGHQKYSFDRDDSFAVLDWGRGVWPYKNTWYWGSASGMAGGKPFGFNIGYGFGDTSAATENMLFYEGKAHKLDEVAFHIPMKGKRFDYMAPWTFTSNDQRFEMAFQPIIDRCDYTTAGIISSDQHQVFGRFNGEAVLDDGRKI
ncbi:DUF2804 domain-containing protein [Bacillus testis]|uniref:DUF2804 domain-containing protein n=1 Tax=Bacillus testis TaxID=1622072 RepID=UPI00067E890F|nr:DUF2804 domain-containing protein [Bacillus testis]